MNEETTSSSVASKSSGLLGEYLKQKRIDKNYSLEKLSQKTKISVNILKCIEANDYGHLPSAAYIKGFVVNYIKVLGLPMEETIAKMEYTYLTVLGKSFPSLNHTKAMSTPTAAKQVKSTEEQSPQDLIEGGVSIMANTKSMLPIAIFGAVILLFIGGYKIVSSVIDNEVSTQKTVDMGPKIESSSALIVKSNKPQETTTIPAPAKTEEKPVEVKATAVETETEKKEEQPKVIEFERNFPPVDFKKVKSKLFTVKTDAPENEDEDLLPEAIKNAHNPSMQNVYIRATEGNTWLSYKIDNNPIESVIINKGSDLFLQGNEIRVFLGNVNVTKIFYNNYLIDAPTKSGVKSLIFPEESNSKFMMPLFPKAKDDILYTSEDYTKRMNLEDEELKKRQQQ